MIFKKITKHPIIDSHFITMANLVYYIRISHKGA